MDQEFKELVENASRIMISSHIAPDPDAIASALLLGTTLIKNYPDKDVRVIFEERPAMKIDFLTDFDKITFANYYETLQSFKPELVIITDANNFTRVSRTQAAESRELVGDLKAKFAIIEHHGPADNEPAVDLLINNDLPSCVQEVYKLCFDELKLAKPAGYADAVMLGILTDTGRFKYPTKYYRETFELAADLIDAGASIERIESQIEYYSMDQVKVIGELAQNLTTGPNFAYSFVSDGFSKGYLGAGKPYADLKGATGIFIDQFIRTVDGRKWGFVAYPDIAGAGKYRVSFRSKDGAMDISKFAVALGGNGHPQSAAGPVAAPTMNDVVQIVLAQIAKLA